MSENDKENSTHKTARTVGSTGSEKFLSPLNNIDAVNLADAEQASKVIDELHEQTNKVYDNSKVKNAHLKQKSVLSKILPFVIAFLIGVALAFLVYLFISSGNLFTTNKISAPFVESAGMIFPFL